MFKEWSCLIGWKYSLKLHYHRSIAARAPLPTKEKDVKGGAKKESSSGPDSDSKKPLLEEGDETFPKDLARRLPPSFPMKFSSRSRCVIRRLLCSIVSRSTPTPVDAMKLLSSVSFCSIVSREPRLCARMEIPSSLKAQSESLIFSSVELLPSPLRNAINSARSSPKLFPDKSSVVMVFVATNYVPK
jgi:hypothetical protein